MDKHSINHDNLGLNLEIEERLYFQMSIIRIFEELLLDLFTQNLLFGTTHTCIGQEINAVAIMNAIDREKDTIWSNHRCHGHFISYSGRVNELLSEIMGKVDGLCAGRGGSQHIYWKNFYSNGIQGGITPLALGSSMAGKEDQAITVVFLGDGTMGQGVVYECLNIAALWKLPVLFVLEDNGIAQTTPTSNSASGNFLTRAKGFGINSKTTETNEALDLYKEAIDIVNYVRSKSIPFFWHIKSLRIGPHSKGDDTRSSEEITFLRSNDPIAILRKKIQPHEVLTEKCKKIVQEALTISNNSPINNGL